MKRYVIISEKLIEMEIVTRVPTSSPNEHRIRCNWQANRF